MKISVDYTKDTTITRYGTGNYDNDDTSSTWSIHGLKFDKGGYRDIDIPFDVVEGEEYYLLYAVYSTGCSFGHDQHGQIEFIDLYKSKEKAQAAFNVIDEFQSLSDSERDNYKNTVNLIREDGKPYSFYVPWNGYFESLSYIEVLPIHLNSKLRKDYR